MSLKMTKKYKLLAKKYILPNLNIIGSVAIVLILGVVGVKLIFLTQASQLDGDTNSDGVVNISDLSILAAHYGITSGATWSMGDFNNDGGVGLDDLAILAAHYGDTLTNLPAVPSGLSATATSSSTVNLSWTADSSSGGTVTYLIYRNATEMSTTTATTYADSGLTGGDTYSYTIAASNSYGTSSQSGAVDVTTTGSSDPSGVPMPGSNAYPGYTQVLGDDFTGTSLNQTTWNGFYQDINQQYGPMLASHGSVTNSEITMSDYVDSAANGASSGTNRAGAGLSTRAGWTSGMVFVRARADGGTGVTMCIGMIGLKNWPPEIDFYEDGKNTSNIRQLFQATVIYGVGVNMIWDINSSVDATQWHTYGVEWNATTISFLVDGVQWASMANPDPSTTDTYSLMQPMKLFMQIETLDWGANNVPVNSSTPAVVNMNVDWATVYTPN